MKFSTHYSLALAVATLAPITTNAFAPCHVPGPVVLPSTVLSMAASSPTSATRNPNPVIKVAAQGMGLLKPIFQLEANLQAAALGAVTGLDKDQVAQDVPETIATLGTFPFNLA